MNSFLLDAAAETTAAGNGIGLVGIILYIAVIGAALYFFMIRPQRKKQKEEKNMRENLQIGDEILTIGGFYFKVISLKDDSMVVESVSDHTKMKIARWAIQQNLTVHDDPSGK